LRDFAARAAERVEGQVVKVDTAAGKVTIRGTNGTTHGQAARSRRLQEDLTAPQIGRSPCSIARARAQSSGVLTFMCHGMADPRHHPLDEDVERAVIDRVKAPAEGVHEMALGPARPRGRARCAGERRPLRS